MDRRSSDLWWKDAIIYCLDVETFFDSDGDGHGDIRGLTDHLDYVSGLGVTCVWLMPFFPTPNLDDGYDITDYYGVEPDIGDPGDFVELVRTAHDRGLRVIIDLVVNHTSDEHPWFRAARADPESPFRDFYVWRDEPPEEPATAPVFPNAEDSIWSWDEVAGQWYLHHFYSHQPDLNITNPAVRHEVAKIAGFWLELGVDGFRVDAVPYLIETGGIVGAEDLDPHELLRDLRQFAGRRRSSAALLGEVNLPPKELRAYFGDGDGDELHMMFNFPAMQAMFLALARQEPGPLLRVLETLPAVPEDAQWANFARNHDELTLDQLTEEERQEVFAAFGPHPGMQLFGRGLRRRLASMLGGDQARIRLVYSLIFSIPGTPVLYYGDELGMGENLDIAGRLSVRTPMQWRNAPNGGFSTADPSQLARPVVEGDFGPERINVADLRQDPESLLSWMGRIIRVRRETPEFGWGRLVLVESGSETVMAHRCDGASSTVLAVHNFSPDRQAVSIPLDEEPEEVEDLLSEEPAKFGPEGISCEFEGYGFRWFRIVFPEGRS